MFYHAKFDPCCQGILEVWEAQLTGERENSSRGRQLADKRYQSTRRYLCVNIY